ncbi:uncharacterized protein LOC119289799 [Triticum dicoccoides]|uniref:uncharacterized protein LOC119289799 n=1 Tax=Triticum dicoccoides TaxID=85692 RepID=UPI00188F17E2|nr:uncharacterized protein LOC119289799 [Triticum dicoccoides]
MDLLLFSAELRPSLPQIKDQVCTELQPCPSLHLIHAGSLLPHQGRHYGCDRRGSRACPPRRSTLPTSSPLCFQAAGNLHQRSGPHAQGDEEDTVESDLHLDHYDAQQGQSLLYRSYGNN